MASRINTIPWANAVFQSSATLAAELREYIDDDFDFVPADAAWLDISQTHHTLDTTQCLAVFEKWADSNRDRSLGQDAKPQFLRHLMEQPYPVLGTFVP